jgi:hypothetical protein
MRLIIIVFLSLLGVCSYAKDVKSATKKQVNLKNSVVVSTQTQSISTQTNKVEKETDIKDDESGVVVDSGFEEDNKTVYKTGEDVLTDTVLPYSFGVLRGTIVIDGKPILVFETDEAIFFVWIYRENNQIKWKLYGKLTRA